MNHFDIFRRALEAMGGAPKNLDRALLTISEFDDLAVPVRSEDLFRVFAENDANHPVSIVFHQKLPSWYYADKPAWADGTGRSTKPRRTLIYDRLSLSEQQRVFCETR